MVGGIFITVNDVQVLLGCERYATAWAYYNSVRDAINKKHSKKITIKEFCEYEDLEFEYIWKLLRVNK
ncbi:MAG: hypothetical protein H0U95_18425 [Bacteroidetes bacterium]|nr:hypothetical protein [Bacteroidota bacterium]